MPVEVRIPERDAPRAGRVALVAMASLMVGLGLAWWGADEARTRADAGSSTSAETSASAPSSAEPRSGRNPPATAETHADAGATAEDHAEAGSSTETTATVDAGATAAVRAEAGASAPTRGETAAASSTSAHAGSLHVRRGRVAYIRCDGLRACTRDEALEAAVWPILDALTACGDPPTTPGEADIRLDYAGAGAPEIVWRDTFPDDTVRLDRDRVLACVSPALAQTRQRLGAERLVVSFRFELVAR